MQMFKIIFLANVNWALKVIPSLRKHPKIEILKCLDNLGDLRKVNLNEYNFLITCGWSEKIENDILNEIHTIGVHCAELDRYSYGSPIQLQIIDGILITKHRVFLLESSLNSKRSHAHNRLFSHEVDLDLTGNMDDILEQMTVTSKALFNMYLNDYPNIVWREWPAEDLIRPKRKQEDSRLTKEQFLKMNTEELYNFFRCLEEPYPNGYLEDELGRLYIQKVIYKKK
jgi:methionyl-tRNA formyltransferase